MKENKETLIKFTDTYFWDVFAIVTTGFILFIEIDYFTKIEKTDLFNWVTYFFLFYALGLMGDGKDAYAVYPDYETGHEALVVMLRGNIYSPLTLREASIRFVPSDPDHIHKIVKLTKLDPERTINHLMKKNLKATGKPLNTTGDGKRDRKILSKSGTSQASIKRRALSLNI